MSSLQYHGTHTTAHHTNPHWLGHQMTSATAPLYSTRTWPPGDIDNVHHVFSSVSRNSHDSPPHQSTLTWPPDDIGDSSPLFDTDLTTRWHRQRLPFIRHRLGHQVTSTNPLICHMNALWALSNKGTYVRFCWVPSHYGIEGNEIVDQLASRALDHDIDPLTTVHYADLKPVVNSYIKQEVQTKWDVSIHGRDLYLVKPTLGPSKKFQHLTRAEEVVITWLRIGHTKATKSHILSRGPPTTCQHCGQTLTIEHMLLECTVLQRNRDEYYTVDSLGTLFETIPEACIVKFLREAGLFYLIWMAI